MATPLVLQNTHSTDVYSLALKIDHTRANFNGSVSICLTKGNHTSSSNDSEAFVFRLHCSELVLLSATFTTSSNETYKANIVYEKSLEQAKLIVENSTLVDEKSLTLDINYIGKVNTTKTFTDVTKGIFKTNYMDDKTNQSTNYVIATHCQTSFARNIFPCVDEPVAKAIYKLSIETNSKFKIISNTSPESKELDESSQLQKITFKETPVMATSIFGFVIGDLDFIESTVQLKNSEVPIRFYTTIGSINGAAYGLDIACKCLPYIESLFDSSYPLDKLDIVALPFLSDGAMENHGLITIQSSHILTKSLNNRQATQSIRQLVAHEIIHHWVGNNVSFDEWDHLWLNEAFATWFAYYVLYKLGLDSLDTEIWLKQGDEELEKLLIEDAMLDTKPIVSKRQTEIKATHDAFQVSSYQKGIQFLRMFANAFDGAKFDDEIPKFVKCIGKFVEEYKTKTIKPADLWKALHQESNLDLLAFSHSWLRLPGFPIVTVSLDDSDKIVIEQHRYLEHTTVEEENLEDVPYHVPLSIKVSDGSVINKVLNDRRVVLEEIKQEEFIKLNTNRTGIYRVQYKDLKLVENIINNIDQLSSLDVIGLLHDLTALIGHPYHHNDLLVISILKISEKIISQEKLNFRVLRYALTALEVIANSFKFHASKDKYSKYSTWLVSLNSKLFQKLNWTQDFTSYGFAELECRKSILTIGLETNEVNKVCEKLFKQLLHGPSRSVPEQLLHAALASVSYRANQNTWKKILELVKQPGATSNNIFGGSSNDIQHAAIKSLGYTRDPALVKRVLNFVTTNIDSTLVELALVGLLHNNEMNKKVLMDWFKLNYDQWAARSTRQGSQYSANLKKTLKGISLIVFNGMTTEDDEKVVKSFVDDKLKKLPEHGLEEAVEEVKFGHEQKIRIAESVDSVLKFI